MAKKNIKLKLSKKFKTCNISLVLTYDPNFDDEELFQLKTDLAHSLDLVRVATNPGKLRHEVLSDARLNSYNPKVLKLLKGRK